MTVHQHFVCDARLTAWPRAAAATRAGAIWNLCSMNGCAAASTAPPPFLRKLRDMLDDPDNHSILSWSSDGATVVLLQVVARSWH